MSKRFTIDHLREHGDVKKFFSRLSDEECAALLKDWTFLARDEQLPPEGDWAYWLYLAGRGAGKTRTGAEWVREKVKEGYKRVGLIAPTAGDVRDVMVEGESGLLAVCWEHDKDKWGNKMGKPLYQPSTRTISWENGAIAKTYSADEPERLRGPQHEAIWADEVCAWRRPETWDLAMFGLRLGKNPQAFISTTPKPKKLILELLKDEASVVTRGSTYSNRANLADQFFTAIVKKFEGTRLGQQELMGVVLEEAEGALWSRETIDATRLLSLPKLNRLTGEEFWFTSILVSVDPATTAKAESDETGIIVVGIGNDKHAYVLADVSGRYSPGQWAAKVNQAYNTWQADYVVAEGNQGGEMVRHVIHSVNKNIPVRIVNASRGKAARAEPIAARFEKGEAHIVGSQQQLEDQLCVWEPLSGDESPDRLDAMVWGMTAGLLGKGVFDSKKLNGFF